VEEAEAGKKLQTKYKNQPTCGSISLKTLILNGGWLEFRRKKEFQLLPDVTRGLGFLVTAVCTWELCRKIG